MSSTTAPIQQYSNNGQMITYGDSTTANYTPTKKPGLFRRLLHRDHQRGAEKEQRKERFHAEKAELYGQKARDANLSDRQRKRLLRKAAKQQASADFHESLKKKHLIGATPGHKDQVVPPMATHHPIIHNANNNVVKTEVHDQNTRPVGAPAVDGIVERHHTEPSYIYSYPAEDESESDVSSVDEREIKNHKALPFSAADLKQGANNLNGNNNDWKNRKALFTRHQLRAGSRALTTAPTTQRNINWLQIKDLKSHGQKLKKAQTIEKGGLSSFSDEWERRKRWQTNSRSMPTQQNYNSGYAYNQLYSEQIREQIHAGKFTTQTQPQQGFVVYASQPALQRQATQLKKTETKKSQGQWLQSKDLLNKSQGLRKTQTMEKGGLKPYLGELAKKSHSTRDAKPNIANNMANLSKAQQQAALNDSNRVTVTVTQSTVQSQ